MSVETYSHVMHIVSSVCGTLREGERAMDALRAACRPARSSGAPKIRAMEIIDELEPVKRGVYGGAIGYLELLRRPRHLHPHPHRRGQGRRRAHAGRRRDRRRLGSGATSTRETAREGARGVRGDRAGRGAGARGGLGVSDIARKVLVIDNYDSFTYNLVQYLGELGAELDVVRNDARDGRRAARARAGPRRDLARARARPTRPASRSRRSRLSPRRGSRCSASASATRRWPRPSAGAVVRGTPVHGKTAEVEHDGRSIFAGVDIPLAVGRYHSLVVSPDEPARRA